VQLEVVVNLRCEARLNCVKGEEWCGNNRTRCGSPAGRRRGNDGDGVENCCAERVPADAVLWERVEEDVRNLSPIGCPIAASVWLAVQILPMCFWMSDALSQQVLVISTRVKHARTLTCFNSWRRVISSRRSLDVVR
jgi:hypothetical protein